MGRGNSGCTGKFWLTGIGLVLLTASLASAQELISRTVTPTTTAFQLDAAPVIDGEVLNDPAWSEVNPTSGFWQVRSAGHPAY